MAIYMWRDVIDTPWIYHNPDLWLISLSLDGNTRMTIADKNLGATTVWNYWDELSEANCGKFYQRGNNYWFPFTWATTKSSTTVNASSYWPNNYYSSSTFITGSYWDNSYNSNLRWYTTGTDVARKWPCENWFHVPSLDDAEELRWIVSFNWLPISYADIHKYLKMPYCWFLWSDNWNYYNNGNYDSFWMCQQYSSTYWKFFTISDNNWMTNTWNQNKTYAYSIRPFFNTPIQPDSSRTVLYSPTEDAQEVL